MKIFSMLVIMGMVSLVSAQTDSKTLMPAIFSDNMVLQQNTEAPIWGWAQPDQNISIRSSWGKSASAVADKNGNWHTKLSTPKAGGPFNFSVQIGDTTISFNNVMSGEVWVCSGQSNMEMPMQGWPPRDTIWGGKNDIAKADYPNIRLFTVTRAYSTIPQNDCVGSWSECTPQTAASFSATAFYFGKKLNAELNIPIGLIHSSWGGTPVESWISGKELGQIDKYKETYEKMKGSEKEIEALNAWLKNHPVINVNGIPEDDKWKGLNFKDEHCSESNYDDSAWHEMIIPKLWESTEVGNFDGVVWFRKNIEIPDKWMNKDLVLNLGAIDDMDISYVNGTKIGAYETGGFWQTERVYPVPANINNSKILSIAVRVIDTQGGGGIWGDPQKLNLSIKSSSDIISLAGLWKFMPVAEYQGGKFFVFGSDGEYFNRPEVQVEISPYALSSLFNGMISPIIPYSIKGAIWYQGESNVGNYFEYKNLFSLMIKNWRKDWGEDDFPFYYVQIAPYNYGAASKSQLLREAQLKTLDLPNTGMAVTMDIGNPDNIHPGDKKDVGERLAKWALAKDYGKKMAYSGPVYKSMKVEGRNAVLSFEYGEGLNIKPVNGKNNFTIAGEDKVFHPAEVKIKGSQLIIYSPEVKTPAAVRYCWSNIEEGTLFNGAGLPSPSFRTDDWND